MSDGSGIFTKGTPFRKVAHECDVCVVGGGMAGVCAALAAARHGARTILVQDRPMLGGNSSSEIGVHICGADQVGQYPHMRETGILEELRLANIFRNPQAELSVWDLVLFDVCLRQENLRLLLNCSVLHAENADEAITSVTGWQLSTQTWHTVAAAIYIDCSGDAILAPLSNAEFRMGREARAEFDESMAPEQADERTMGLAHMYYTRTYEQPVPFVPYDWARVIETCDELPWDAPNHKDLRHSPWWCELGGENHSIHDSEEIRNELLKLNLGLWDHIKNRRCEHREAAVNRAISQICFVPGRRESRRYVGLHLLTQNDIAGGGKFPDVVAYGGWPLDDHHPAGVDSFRKHGQPPNRHELVPIPYGIPYRSLVSKNVRNLMFAGRNASCTHIAMSSTRVMGTCAVMGQAAGTAAAEAVRRGCLPLELVDDIAVVQQQLLRDDVYLPGVRQKIAGFVAAATITVPRGDPEALRDGINRQVGDNPHAIVMRPGESVEYRFTAPTELRAVSLTFDTAMERSIAFRAPGWQFPLPAELPKAFTLEVEHGGVWQSILAESDNWQRHRVVPCVGEVDAVRYTLDETYGAQESRLYGFIPEEKAVRGEGCEAGSGVLSPRASWHGRPARALEGGRLLPPWVVRR